MPTPKDVISRHAHFLEQYYNGQVNRFTPFLKRVAKRLREELLKTNTVISTKRIKAKLAFVEAVILEEYGAYTADFNEQLELFAQSEVEFAAGILEKDDVVNVVLPSPHQTVAAINARPFDTKLLKEELADFTKSQVQIIRNAVSQGFYEGKTTQDIVREVIGTKARGFKDGQLNISRTKAERMVRTALNHTSTIAKEKIFSDNEDIVKYYEIIATLDSRTSPHCRKWDGYVFKIGKGKLPPFHPNCRTTTGPVLDEVVKLKDGRFRKKEKEGGERASIKGPVSADLDYNDWLKQQSKSFQLDVLGKKRYELFAKGDLHMDKFVNDKNQVLTLAQLKEKYPTAWGKI